MDIQKTTGEHSTIVLTIVFDDAEMKQYEKVALKKLSSEVKLDGFRAGHVPEAMLRSRVGEMAIQQETVDVAINEAYRKALQQETIFPISYPEVSVESVAPLKVVYKIPVYPEVTVSTSGLDGFTLSAVTIGDAEIDETIEMFRKNLAEQKEVTRASQIGDIAEIDFDGKDENGVSQPGMKSEHHPLELGSKTFIPGFEEEVVGLSAGEEKTFPITFPEDYQAKEYAGKQFFFMVLVHSVSEKALPEVDDAFVKKLTGKEQTVAELKEEISTHLLEKKKNEEYAAKQQALFDAIGMNTTADVPKAMLDEELDTIIDNIKMQGLQMGLPWEKYLEMTQKTEAQVREEMISQAEKTVKSRLGLKKLLEEQDISIDESEIHMEIARELAMVSKNQRAEKEHFFAKGNEGWISIENRLQIRTFFKKMLHA